jgi:hypothetical protein
MRTFSIVSEVPTHVTGYQSSTHDPKLINKFFLEISNKKQKFTELESCVVTVSDLTLQNVSGFTSEKPKVRGTKIPGSFKIEFYDSNTIPVIGELEKLCKQGNFYVTINYVDRDEKVTDHIDLKSCSVVFIKMGDLSYYKESNLTSNSKSTEVSIKRPLSHVAVIDFEDFTYTKNNAE